jgi:hypothetical protein
MCFTSYILKIQVSSSAIDDIEMSFVSTGAAVAGIDAPISFQRGPIPTVVLSAAI